MGNGNMRMRVGEIRNGNMGAWGQGVRNMGKEDMGMKVGEMGKGKGNMRMEVGNVWMGVGGMRMGILEHGEKSGQYGERGYGGGGDEEGVHGMGSMRMRVGNTEKGNMRTGWGIWGRDYGNGGGGDEEWGI
jgi:hypothetical protein